MTKIFNINIKRLNDNLQSLSAIGRNELGGIDRILGSRPEREGRQWLVDYWNNNLNKKARTDSIANLWIKRDGEESLPSIVIGSHLDTVPNGGMYDGALGVLMATEIMQTLEDYKIATRHPVEVVSFTGEEPNPFNVSTLGSKVLCGRLGREDLIKLRSIEDGTTLQECVLKIGGDITKADNDLLTDKDISAFIECHIEQGRRLYDTNTAVASVSCITGIYRESVVIDGEANHAGTTVMKDRHDALLAAAELNIVFENIIKAFDSDEVTGTIGYMDISPNAVNIIPGKVRLILEIRACSSKVKNETIRILDTEVEKICKKRGLRINRTVNLDQPEMHMDKSVSAAINNAMEMTGQPQVSLVSMAGHDAANMQRITKSGMIFVQSIDGKSHCNEERTGINEIEKAGNAMLCALLLLDKELD